MPKIGIIDYGVGNLRSVQNAVQYGNKEVSCSLIRDPNELKDFSHIILPGVGAFENAIQKVRAVGFDEALHEVVEAGHLLLGICLGMQLLANRSYEFGEHEGLGLIPGEVKSLKEGTASLRVPHIGWNSVEFQSEDHPLFQGLESGSDFYFVHSFYFSCLSEEHVLGVTDYGRNFSSVVGTKNVFGAQFHPEKSQEMGLQVIKNFLDMKLC